MKYFYLAAFLFSYSGHSQFIQKETSEFSQLFKDASTNGSCKVSKVKSKDTTFFIPKDPKNSDAKFNVLVWGNGSATSNSTYKGILESIASHCIFVAAATTAASGSGKEMQTALRNARSRYSKQILENPKICTAGHSQGGGGSFNAAILLKANCAIPVQADTVYTSKISGPLDPKIEVIALWGSSDTIAPAHPANFKNIEKYSSILTSIETSSEGHFTITSGRGGDIGTLFRMAAIAQLSTDSYTSRKFRRAFWGPQTNATVTKTPKEILDVIRDSGAINASP